VLQSLRQLSECASKPNKYQALPPCFWKTLRMAIGMLLAMCGGSLTNIRLHIRLVVLVLAPIALSAQSNSNAAAQPSSPVGIYTPPPGAALIEPLTPKQKVKRRAVRAVEPVSLLAAAFGGGIEQWRGTPPQWGQGVEGYAKRFASAEGYMVAHNAISLGFDLAFHLDPRYRRMPGESFGVRIKNAVSQSFIARTDSGGKTFNISEVVGCMSAGVVANLWEPPGYRSLGDGLERGAIGFAYHTLKNVVREFLPDLVQRK
jgi:hypothetical protein